MNHVYVYLVMGYIRYQGDVALSLWSTEELAEKAAAVVRGTHDSYFDRVEVVCREVDEDETTN